MLRDCDMATTPTLLRRCSEAFTLLELLTVLAIVAVFAGMVFAASRSTSNTASIARARAELGAMGAALESYRSTYGDYPRTGDAGVLLQCLIGKRGPTNVEVAGKSVIGLASFTTLDGLDPYISATAQPVDPWMQPYRYAYKTSPSWAQSHYVLYSTGPDRVSAVLDSAGRIDRSEAENRDNIHQ